MSAEPRNLQVSLNSENEKEKVKFDMVAWHSMFTLFTCRVAVHFDWAVGRQFLTGRRFV